MRPRASAPFTLWAFTLFTLFQVSSYSPNTNTRNPSTRVRGTLAACLMVFTTTRMTMKWRRCWTVVTGNLGASRYQDILRSRMDVIKTTTPTMMTMGKTFYGWIPEGRYFLTPGRPTRNQVLLGMGQGIIRLPSQEVLYPLCKRNTECIQDVRTLILVP